MPRNNNSGSRAALAVTALIATIALTACNWNQPARDTAPSADAPASTPAAPAAERQPDHQLITEVQSKFYADDTIRARQIDVTAENSVVTLRGTVPDNAAKERAVSLARGVEGVTSVNDQLEVRAASAAERTDDPQQRAAADRDRPGIQDETQPAWITTKIQAQYFMDPDISPWNIDVTTASGGVVTLEGSVDSEDNKNDAVRIARQTEGVTRVEDRLRVAPDARQTQNVARDQDTPVDTWLSAKIAAKYFIDTDVKGRRIDIDTRDGVVTLTGQVANEAERRQAVALARNTDGVREVRDQLSVDASLRDRTTADNDRQRAATDIDRPDAWITTKVQAQYFLDPEVKGHEINVDTVNGVVTLKGFVETAEQKTEAEQIARDTEGVRRVVNRLNVGPRGATQ